MAGLTSVHAGDVVCHAFCVYPRSFFCSQSARYVRMPPPEPFAARSSTPPPVGFRAHPLLWSIPPQDFATGPPAMLRANSASNCFPRRLLGPRHRGKNVPTAHPKVACRRGWRHRDRLQTCSRRRKRDTVSGAPPLVETQPSGISSLLDERAITGLPLNGRRFTDLALLTPGVTQDPRGLTSGSNGDLAFGGIRAFNPATWSMEATTTMHFSPRPPAATAHPTSFLTKWCSSFVSLRTPTVWSWDVPAERWSTWSPSPAPTRFMARISTICAIARSTPASRI